VNLGAVVSATAGDGLIRQLQERKHRLEGVMVASFACV
jgi:hypothetical protein